MRKVLTIAIFIELKKKDLKINFSSQNFNVVLECNFYEYDTSFSILCRKSTIGTTIFTLLCPSTILGIIMVTQSWITRKARK